MRLNSCKNTNIKAFIDGVEVNTKVHTIEFIKSESPAFTSISGSFPIKITPSFHRFLNQFYKRHMKLKQSRKLHYKKAKSQSKSWSKRKNKK